MRLPKSRMNTEFYRKNTIESNPRGFGFQWCFHMAEQQGFEPWQHFHALRDFESRLFDQLEYCSL